MSQSKIASLVEVIVGTAIGYVVSFIAWPVAGWFFDLPISTAKQAGIVLFFTVISLVRGYIVRRWFEGFLRRFNERLAAWIESKLNYFIKGKKDVNI